MSEGKQNLLKYWPIIVACGAVVGTWAVLQWRIGALESRMEKIEVTVSSIQISVGRIEGKLEGKNLTLKP